MIKSDDYCKAEAWPQNGHELIPKQAKRPKTAPFSAFSKGKNVKKHYFAERLTVSRLPGRRVGVMASGLQVA
nr:hypothetical protein [Clostridia bacterium]